MNAVGTISVYYALHVIQPVLCTKFVYRVYVETIGYGPEAQAAVLYAIAE
jgi:hypothetical protein